MYGIDIEVAPKNSVHLKPREFFAMLPLILAIFASSGRLAGGYEDDRYSHPFILRLAF